MKKLYLSVLLVAVTATLAMAIDYAVVEKRLAYLSDIPEVAEVVFVRNNVYIGFESLPDDFETIVRAAAFHGNKALGRRVHVWACKYVAGQDHRAWPWYCFATGQNGKVVNYETP